MYYQFVMPYMLIWVYHLMQCMANLGESRNFREGLAGIYLAQFSLNNVHKRGLKHHHFIWQEFIGLQSQKMVDFKWLHNTITISLSIGIIMANIFVIGLVHTKECHNKVLLYVIYSFISSPATKVSCYRHLGHTYNSSTATSVLGIIINRLLSMCGLDWWRFKNESVVNSTLSNTT